MKKAVKYLLILLVAVLLPINVFAKGSVTANKTSLTITKGSSATITLTANNAAGRLDISSSNTKIATVGATSIWLDNQSQSIKVTGKAVGSTTIVIKKTDVATYDSEVLSGNIVINVKVVEKTTPTPNPNPTPEPTPVEEKKSDAYEVALIGVKKVESSLNKADYDTVKDMVNALKDENEKKELLNRLSVIESNLKEVKCDVVECQVCEKCTKSGSTAWIIISITLLLLLIAESVYFYFKHKDIYEDYS